MVQRLFGSGQVQPRVPLRNWSRVMTQIPRNAKFGLLAATAIALGITGQALAQTPPHASAAAGSQAGAAGRPPNILILWGDDIGYWNISTYNQGMMGYKTPNIDRIAREGGFFTDAAIDFLKRAKEQNKPFFLWWNTTRMHIWTRLKPESQA
jgi:hypothetical protein